MEEKVRAEYEAILAEVVIDRGALVKEDPSEFEWKDPDAYAEEPHLSTCRVTQHGRPVESRWPEFVGTFADPTSETRHGVDLPGVWCECGVIQDRTLRLEIQVQELAEEMFTRLYRKLPAPQEPEPPRGRRPGGSVRASKVGRHRKRSRG